MLVLFSIYEYCQNPAMGSVHLPSLNWQASTVPHNQRHTLQTFHPNAILINLDEKVVSVLMQSCKVTILLLKYLVQLEHKDSRNLSAPIPSVATSTMILLPRLWGLSFENGESSGDVL